MLFSIKIFDTEENIKHILSHVDTMYSHKDSLKYKRFSLMRYRLYYPENIARIIVIKYDVSN